MHNFGIFIVYIVYLSMLLLIIIPLQFVITIKVTNSEYFQFHIYKLGLKDQRSHMVLEWKSARENQTDLLNLSSNYHTKHYVNRHHMYLAVVLHSKWETKYT